MSVSLQWQHPHRPGPTSDWRGLILPGGGYDHVAIAKEGVPAARWLAARGISSAIASYRVAPHRYPAPLEDARWSLEQVRRSAPGCRVLVWGFSAGGHLAGMLAAPDPPTDRLAADPVTRPDLLILSYPVVSLRTSDGHAGSARRLLGADAPEQLRSSLSLDRLLGSDTPPTVIAHGAEDRVVPPQQSRLLHGHLRSIGVESRLQIVPGAGHGVGLLPSPPPENWLAASADLLADHRSPR